MMHEKVKHNMTTFSSMIKANRFQKCQIVQSTISTSSCQTRFMQHSVFSM